MQCRPRISIPAHDGVAWLETLLALSLLSLILQLLWPAINAWHNRPRAGIQVSARFDGEAGSLEYLLYLPEGYGDMEYPWPLLLFLHGSGERGRDLEKVRGSGLPSIVDLGTSLPMIVVSPQCPENQEWQPELLLELLNEIERHFVVDADRIYLTGYSMGGSGVWNLAAAAPDRFAAAVPVCGSGDTSKADRLAKFSIWAFHGAQDKTVPLKASQEMVAAIQAAGGDAKLTIYPDQGHGICHLVYRDSRLYKWLLGQYRMSSEPATTALKKDKYR